MSKEQRLVEIAKSYVGTKESGGDNKGPQVEAFQKAVDGKAVSESWCVSFIQYCAKAVDSELGGNTNKLAQTEHVLTLWRDTDHSLRLDKPEVGCVMLWEHYKDGVRTGLGHAGIVTEVLTKTNQVMTVEGNTSDGSGVNRNGDGVYSRQRSIISSPQSTMKVLGFLKVWEQEDELLKPDESFLPEEPTEQEIEEKLKQIENLLKGVENDV